MSRNRILVLAVAVFCLAGGVCLAAYARGDRGVQGAQFGDSLALTPEMAGWAEQVRDIPGVHIGDFGQSRLVLVARGEQPTAGYEVRAVAATRAQDGSWTIEVEYGAPAAGEMVTQVITYPYAAVAVPDDGSPVTVYQVGGGEPQTVPLAPR